MRAKRSRPFAQGDGSLTVFEALAVRDELLDAGERGHLPFISECADLIRSRPLAFDFAVNRQRGFAVELTKEDYRYAD